MHSPALSPGPGLLHATPTGPAHVPQVPQAPQVFRPELPGTRTAATAATAAAAAATATAAAAATVLIYGRAVPACSPPCLPLISLRMHSLVAPPYSQSPPLQKQQQQLMNVDCNFIPLTL